MHLNCSCFSNPQTIIKEWSYYSLAIMARLMADDDFSS